MSANVAAYHVLELQIASNPADVRRVVPAIKREHERLLDVGCGAGQKLIASTLGANVTAISRYEDIRIHKRVFFVVSATKPTTAADGR